MGKYALFLINLFVFFHSFVNIQSTVLSARIFSHYPRHNFSPGANFHRYHHFGFHYFHTASVESSILSRLLALPTTTWMVCNHIFCQTRSIFVNIGPVNCSPFSQKSQLSPAASMSKTRFEENTRRGKIADIETAHFAPTSVSLRIST